MARNRYDQDEVIEEHFDLKQLIRLKNYVSPYKGKMALVLFLMLSASALQMFLPKFMQMEMDVYIPNKDMNGVIRLAVLTAIIVIYSVVCTRIKIMLTTRIGQDIIHKIREDLFVHLQKLPFSYYDERPHGKIQVRVVNYINNLSDLLSNGIINTITDFCNLIFIIVFMFYMDARLTLICLCGLPILMTYIMVLKRKQRVSWQRQSNKQSNLNAYISESINGIKVTQAFVREEENTKIFNHLSMSYQKAWLRAVYFNFAMGPMVDLISTVTTSFIYVIGVSMILDTHTIKVGVIIAFTAYISRFWQPITTLANFYNSVLTAISYVERIFETIDEPVTITDSEDAEEMPEIQGNVAFKNVTFAYEDDINILENVSFKVKKGETIAIVGPTGAGKTTIVNLISRFYDVNDGAVLIDGHDVRSVTLNSLRKQMGVMMQDSFIFSGTVMENIRYGNKVATDEDVKNAAKVVCAHDFIKKLDKGYDTFINERGSRLSAGQRQLISFARALLADPKILILDEATSSIDTETELVLQEGLAKLLKGRTSFVIAHRLSTIRNADKIMYVDNGKIVEVGNHDELLKKKGKYYKLYESQYAAV
ncbi:MAG: ABC transporter ATP-binding protein/permease [Lachnospiraceae bacterium]|nr:ABC transporter ATP-binding protein/permease [Lachnospiraceae bacterium]